MRQKMLRNTSSFEQETASNTVPASAHDLVDNSPLKEDLHLNCYRHPI